jgi:hypothetical protein
VSARNGASPASAATDGEARKIAPAADRASSSKPKSSKSQQSWRDVLPVHPAADLFPMMSRDELLALGEDIKKHELKSPVIVFTDKGKDYLLDGRNRLAAMELVGLPTVFPNGLFMGFSGALNCQRVTKDPYAYAISANIHRRLLTSEQKRELIEKVLKAKPGSSNRQIAKQVKADDKTVAKIRSELEAAADIPQLKTREGADGKVRKQPKKRDLAKERRAREERKHEARGDLPSIEEILSAPADDAQTEVDKAEVRELWSKVQAAEAEAGASESFLDSVTGWLKCIGRHADSHARLMLDSDWSKVTLADCKVMLRLLDEAQEPIHRIRAKVRSCKDAIRDRSILERSDPHMIAELDATGTIADNDSEIPGFLRRELSS